MGSIGLTLLLLCVACHRPIQTRRSLGHDVTISIESPRAKVRYPDSVPVRVTIRNSGTRPFTMTWPPSFRPDLGCNGKAQREPVQLSFRGRTFDRSFESKPFAWHWQPSSAPGRLVIRPMSSHIVIDTVFTPPPGAHMLDGGFCAYVYGLEMSGGARYEGPRS